MQKKLQALIRLNLTDELRKKEFRGNPNKLAGHCYVASEVFYHLTGKKLTAMVMRLDSGGTHWFLKDSHGNIVDITASQFSHPINYSKAKPIGFLTKQPSKRAKILIKRINSSRNI